MTQEDETNVLVALVCLHVQTPHLQKNASGKGFLEGFFDHGLPFTCTICWIEVNQDFPETKTKGNTLAPHDHL